MIKEFKNGNVNINLKWDIKQGYLNLEEDNLLEYVYEGLTDKDYYQEEIEGELYLVNYRTKFIYTDYGYAYNPICSIVSDLEKENHSIKIYPLNKKECKELWTLLDNMNKEEVA